MSKTKKPTTSQYVREIKRINAQFRKLKRKDGPAAVKLAELKDKLIDAMQAACPHPRAFETQGSPSEGPFGLGGGPMRLCARCGLVEAPGADTGYVILVGLAAVVTHDVYRVRQGQTQKRLGINL